MLIKSAQCEMCTVKHGGGRVMVRGCFAVSRVGDSVGTIWKTPQTNSTLGFLLKASGANLASVE